MKHGEVQCRQQKNAVKPDKKSHPGMRRVPERLLEISTSVETCLSYVEKGIKPLFINFCMEMQIA
jgi:hypothetical protein